MKLLSFFSVVLAACGSSTNPTDGGGSDSMTGGDSSSGSDSSAGDSSTSDSGSADSAKGEGGQGDMCDLQNDMCGAGLKCCSEPTHMQPPTHDICVPPTSNGTCPMYP